MKLLMFITLVSFSALAFDETELEKDISVIEESVVLSGQGIEYQISDHAQDINFEAEKEHLNKYTQY